MWTNFRQHRLPSAKHHLLLGKGLTWPLLVPATPWSFGLQTRGGGSFQPPSTSCPWLESGLRTPASLRGQPGRGRRRSGAVEAPARCTARMKLVRGGEAEAILEALYHFWWMLWSLQGDVRIKRQGRRLRAALEELGIFQQVGQNLWMFTQLSLKVFSNVLINSRANTYIRIN